MLPPLSGPLKLATTAPFGAVMVIRIVSAEADRPVPPSDTVAVNL